MADDSNGVTHDYHVKSGQGFLIFPGQINTYIADTRLPWEYCWLEFDGLRVKEALSMTELALNHPIYHSHDSQMRQQMMEEMLYIANHSDQSPYHLIGHLYLFLDLMTQSCRNTTSLHSGKMSDFYIKEAINYIEQNFQNSISIENLAKACGINRCYFGKIFRNAIGCIFREICASVPKERSAIPLETERSSAGC